MTCLNHDHPNGRLQQQAYDYFQLKVNVVKVVVMVVVVVVVIVVKKPCK